MTALIALPVYSASPIDRALRERAQDQGISDNAGEILQQRDFGNGHNTRAILRRVAGAVTLSLTGAPEEVFAACTTIPPDLQEHLSAETSQGRRVIAVARKVLSAEPGNRSLADLEHDLTCRGLISFDDPPRAGVEETIRNARAAGIRTIMVTGDHPRTAREIARQIGIWSPQDPLLTGIELDRLTDEALQAAVQTTRVFARTTPQHKYRIVQALQKNGEVVAVTGDGINDALALRGADVGIAMGIRGTDVARDAAEVVLADDNYITITTGIFEGRKFFDNLEKGIRYYLSIKLALICIFLLPVIAGLPLPFAPIQIIVLELFMDLGASAGFVAEPAEADIFTRKPRGRDERVFSRRMLRGIAANSLMLFTVVIAAWGIALLAGRSPQEAQTYAFSAWIFGHIALAYTSRSERVPLLRGGIFTNRVINLWAAAAILTLLAGIYLPFLNRAILLEPIPLPHILIVAAGVSSGIALLELRKIRPQRAA
jgi:Ca2+-transporting ATPase